MVLGEPGCAQEKEEGETAWGFDGGPSFLAQILDVAECKWACTFLQPLEDKSH